MINLLKTNKLVDLQKRSDNTIKLLTDMAKSLFDLNSEIESEQEDISSKMISLQSDYDSLENQKEKNRKIIDNVEKLFQN